MSMREAAGVLVLLGMVIIITMGWGSVEGWVDVVQLMMRFLLGV